MITTDIVRQIVEYDIQLWDQYLGNMFLDSTFNSIVHLVKEKKSRAKAENEVKEAISRCWMESEMWNKAQILTVRMNKWRKWQIFYFNIFKFRLRVYSSTSFWAQYTGNFFVLQDQSGR